MFWQQLITGLAMGCLYALVALAFILVFKATEIVNFAVGEMMMFCAYFCYFMITVLFVPYWIAFFLTVLFAMVIGLMFHFSLKRMLGAAQFSIVIATIGMGIIIRGFVGIVGGTDTYSFPSPFSTEPYNIAGLVVSKQCLWIIIVAIFLLVVFYYFFNRTLLGSAMRATSRDYIASQLMGINVRRIHAIIWMISSVIGAIAGIMISPITFLFIGVGAVGLKAFPAAVLGGWGSIPGAVVGSVIIGISENLAGGYLPKGFKDVFAWVVLILVLCFKPEGIFGVHERKKV